ncbi:MAG: 2-hydroxychromene-2-carboxylate isomerase [Rhodocyclaceae bacterium]|nr:2-hydroxychromene-2-carboxylate isomerase [Rhodocyclaceae bacterium]
MQKKLDFYFDFGSPAAYLAYTQLSKLAADTGAQIELKPILLGGIFQATGNRPPISVPLKGQYLFADLNRFAKRYGVVLNMNPHFPINTLNLMRADIGLQLRNDTRLPKYRDAMFAAIWVDQQNMNDPETVGTVLAKSGFDPMAISALAGDPEVKEALKIATQEAVNQGVFGAPSFIVDGELFWGQDRLDFVREALRG